MRIVMATKQINKLPKSGPTHLQWARPQEMEPEINLIGLLGSYLLLSV